MPGDEPPVRPQLVRIVPPGSRMAGLVASGSVLFVCLSILVAMLGPDDGPLGPAASAPASPPDAGRAGPIDVPRLALYGDGPFPTAVLVRAPGPQLVDLSTGRFGPELDAAAWPDEWFQLADDQLVCLCRSVTPLPARIDEVTLAARITELDGTLVREIPAGHWLVRYHRFAGDEPEGYGLQTAAVLSRDRRSLVVGRAALGWASWQVGVDVIDLTGQVPLRSAELDTLPLADPVHPEHIFAPSLRLSPSGDAALLHAEVPCCRNDARARTWSVRIGPEAITDVRAWPENPVPPKVSCQRGGVASADLSVALCYDELADVQFLARFSLEGTLLGRTNLTMAGGPSDIAIDPVRPRAYLWSRTARTLSIVDLADGRLRTTITVPLGYETSGAPDLGRMLSRWLAPPAAANVLVEPALALSPEGLRLYAIGLDALDGRGEPRTTGIFVFDLARRDLVARWTVDTDVTSIRLSADGSTLFAASRPVPSFDPSGKAEREAAIVGLDARTGELRLVAGRLGAHPILFPTDG